ncbi:MAG: hypothetical protein Q9227_008037 [Pyrenula ochraceoflavens]
MDECFRLLDETKECPNDSILVQQVRLQLKVEKAASCASEDQTSALAATAGSISVYLESLLSQVQDIRGGLLSNSKTNGSPPCNNPFAELDVSLSPTFLHTHHLTLHQRKHLITGFESIRSWFNVFFTITPAAYVGFPFSIFSQLAGCLMTLYRLSTLDDPTWDENGVLKSESPLRILDRVVNNMEQVATFVGLDNSDSPDGDIFSRVAQMFRSVRPSWESNLRRDDVVRSNVDTPPSLDEPVFSDTLGLDVFDPNWLMDLYLLPDQ